MIQFKVSELSIIRQANLGVRRVFHTWTNDSDVISYYSPFYNQVKGINKAYKHIDVFINSCIEDVRNHYLAGKKY